MNRELLNKIFIFAAGAGIGSVVTWKLVKTKYEQIAQEEIESVREVYATRKAETSEELTEEVEDDEDDSMDELEMEKKEYHHLINESGYLTESEEKEETAVKKPYVISPGEFGDSDYANITLWYYSDGVVSDDNGKIIANTEELIGTEFADHFGEYEEDPDAVYVRNDELEIDYEILMEYRAYSEI